MTQVSPQTAHTSSKYLEEILVVKQTHLFPHGAWHGIQTEDITKYLHIIRTYQEFMPRGIMETDHTYKQIIPYLIFKHQDSYFLMQRSAHASETRLQNKYSLGIGGHMRKADMEGSTIFEWAQREFHEEVSYSGNVTVKTIGLLNDDSNEVGKVHLGLVLLLEGDSDKIAIKSELQSGSLCTLVTIKNKIDLLENWSTLILPYL